MWNGKKHVHEKASSFNEHRNLTISKIGYCKTEIRYSGDFEMLSKSGLEFMNWDWNICKIMKIGSKVTV